MSNTQFQIEIFNLAGHFLLKTDPTIDREAACYVADQINHNSSIGLKAGIVTIGHGGIELETPIYVD